MILAKCAEPNAVVLPSQTASPGSPQVKYPIKKRGWLGCASVPRIEKIDQWNERNMPSMIDLSRLQEKNKTCVTRTFFSYFRTPWVPRASHLTFGQCLRRSETTTVSSVAANDPIC